MPPLARLSTLLRCRPLRIWPPPALCPETPALPPADAAEPLPERALLLADAVAQLLVIDYRDAAGQGSRRRITVRRIWADLDGDAVIEAFCHERQAPRCFRAARILTVTDPVTGMEFSETAWFLRRHLGAVPGPVLAGDHTAQALARCRAELALLVCLAPGDGHVAAAAQAPVLIHVADRCIDLSYSKARVLGYIGRLYPDGDALLRALAQLPTLPDRYLRRLACTAAALLEAGGAVDPADWPLLEELYLTATETDSAAA